MRRIDLAAGIVVVGVLTATSFAAVTTSNGTVELPACSVTK